MPKNLARASQRRQSATGFGAQIEAAAAERALDQEKVDAAIKILEEFGEACKNATNSITRVEKLHYRCFRLKNDFEKAMRQFGPTSWTTTNLSRQWEKAKNDYRSAVMAIDGEYKKLEAWKKEHPEATQWVKDTKNLLEPGAQKGLGERAAEIKRELARQKKIEEAARTDEGTVSKFSLN